MAIKGYFKNGGNVQSVKSSQGEVLSGINFVELGEELEEEFIERGWVGKKFDKDDSGMILEGGNDIVREYGIKEYRYLSSLCQLFGYKVVWSGHSHSKFEILPVEKKRWGNDIEVDSDESDEDGEDGE